MPVMLIVTRIESVLRGMYILYIFLVNQRILKYSIEPYLKMYKISDNNTNTINAKYKNIQLTFPVDTGADIYLVRKRKAFEGEQFNPEEKRKLTGITKQGIHSFGTTGLIPFFFS